MQINYNEQNRVFKIDTEHTSYCIGIVDEENFVGHIYYGRKLTDDNLCYLMRTMEQPFVPSIVRAFKAADNAEGGGFAAAAGAEQSQEFIFPDIQTHIIQYDVGIKGLCYIL